MGILISTKDKKWLKENFEDLEITKKPLLIIGRLCFNYIYKDIPICDSYMLRIEENPEGIITVFEIGGKIKKIAQKLSMPLLDLHINTQGSLCLSLPLIEDDLLGDNYSIVKYIETLVIPFLYSTTHLYKFGKRPWGEYGHGILGYLEAYANNDIKYSDFKRACSILKDDPCKIKTPFKKRDFFRIIQHGRPKEEEIRKLKEQSNLFDN